MCSFKYCRKSGRCFLERVSPCSIDLDKEHLNASETDVYYEGFLEPNMLLSVLGFETKATPSSAQKETHTKAA